MELHMDTAEMVFYHAMVNRVVARVRLLLGGMQGGLFIGVELVLNQDTREPARVQAAYVVNRLRDLGVLTGTDGPFDKGRKRRPPRELSLEQTELFISRLDQVLGESHSRT